MPAPARSKGKIGVLIEEHFDETEYREFNEYFPAKGYEVVYLSHLWGLPYLKFASNPENGRVNEYVTVSTELQNLDLTDYKAILAIGAYAMDRLRYQPKVARGQKNNSPAVVFLRRAMQTEHLKLGAICHGLWLWCADPDLIRGRKVTCTHNIVGDVENAGGEIVYEGDGTADLAIDGNLITAKHPAVNQRFMEAVVAEIEKR
jgi:protease I